MKTLRTVIGGLGLALLVVLAGCSTPQTRIQKDPATFARLTPAQQDLVQNGRIELGMDKATVDLALGKPDRTRTRASERGSTEVWIYMAHEGSVRGSLYYGRGHFTPYGSRWWGAGPIFYADDYESYPRLKVEFKDNRVTSIEQESR
jgi:outer membrane protein assembly factor BamE (lipoprotein component of BamABCDE complex)